MDSDLSELVDLLGHFTGTPDEHDRLLRLMSGVYPGLKDILGAPVVQASDVPDLLRRSVNLGVAPWSGTVWIGEQARAWLSHTLEAHLKFVPPEHRVPPDPSVAGPVLDGLKHNLHREELREMFAKLMASAMDGRSAEEAHPAFAEIIRQLVPDEAKVLQHYSRRFTRYRWQYPTLSVSARDKNDRLGAIRPVLPHYWHEVPDGVEHGGLLPRYIDNLARLGIIRYDYDRELLSAADEYAAAENALRLYAGMRNSLARHAIGEDSEPVITRGIIRVTDFGVGFIRNCVPPKARPKRA